MGKVRVPEFQPRVCTGCPHRQRTTEGEGLVGLAARVEGAALETATGRPQYACGLCGCPLAHLSLLNLAPEGCPRLEDHQ